MIFDLADHLLPGVSLDLVAEALGKAAGQELASGKFGSPQSSSALAVNGFGFFLGAPGLLPPFPGFSNIDWPAVQVDVERQMRFPWSGGRHPWLDAAVETENYLIGVESKRYEPFRDRKRAKISPKYASVDWGAGMDPWCQMRDRLLANPSAYRHLDAAQLVKHSYGLVTEARRLSSAPTAAAHVIALEFEWLALGQILLDGNGYLAFPSTGSDAGLYRFRIDGNGVGQVYIGESMNLRRRFGFYRTPGSTQPTNIRINTLFKQLIETGAVISVDTIRVAETGGRELSAGDGRRRKN